MSHRQSVPFHCITQGERTAELREVSQLILPCMCVLEKPAEAKGTRISRFERQTVVERALQRRSREYDVHLRADGFHLGENVLLDWAKIVDCGDAQLTFLVR